MERSRARSAKDGQRRRNSGGSDCPVRGGPCAPVNRVTIWPVKGGKVKDFCTCTCGHRFGLSDNSPGHLLEIEGVGAPVEVPAGASEGWSPGEVVDPEVQVPWAALGVVPVGTAALHAPTRPVGAITADIKWMAKHMIAVMNDAPGVGLAANQVGASLRMFVQVHKKALPQVVIDPIVRARDGEWTYTEGCLSLEVEGSHGVLDRPGRIQMRARTVHGEVFEATVDEMTSRICQHEIDHLDGLLYAQRLIADEHDRVYRLLSGCGIDTALLPSAPY